MIIFFEFAAEKKARRLRSIDRLSLNRLRCSELMYLLQFEIVFVCVGCCSNFRVHTSYACSKFTVLMHSNLFKAVFN